MVLKVLDFGEITEAPRNLKSFLDTYIKASSFTSIPVRTVQVEDGNIFIYFIKCIWNAKINLLWHPPGLVYVGQREVAFLNPTSTLNVLGSEDATTCHIVVMRNPDSGLTCLAHLDQVRAKGLDLVVEKLQSPNGVEIHVFGGYEDENDTSEDLSLDLLQYLVKSVFV